MRQRRSSVEDEDSSPTSPPPLFAKPSMTGKTGSSWLHSQKLTAYWTGHFDRKQSAVSPWQCRLKFQDTDTENLCGTPSPVGGHWMLKISNGRRHRRDDGYETIVRVEGTGTSLFRGQKIPFTISGFFNYKTRRIWLERTNTGVRSNVTLYEGVLLGSKHGGDRVMICCHILGGSGELNMFLGNESIGLWTLPRKDASSLNLSHCKIEDYFDTFGCHEAKILTQELECDANTMHEFCRVCSESSPEKIWKMHIEPLIKWQGKAAFERTLMSYVFTFFSRYESRYVSKHTHSNTDTRTQ